MLSLKDHTEDLFIVILEKKILKRGKPRKKGNLDFYQVQMYNGGHIFSQLHIIIGLLVLIR